MRIVKKLANVTVRYNSEWSEYQVSINGAVDDSATYYTSNKQDALDTATNMHQQLISMSKTHGYPCSLKDAVMNDINKLFNRG